MKKVRFIVNPFSGNNRKRDMQRLIADNLDPELFDYELCLTTHAGHAPELALEAVEAGYFMVVACGGDGSVNEVASALIHSETVLGVLPCGSGNGFAEHLGTGRNVPKAIALLNSGKVLQIDTASFNGHPFVNLAGIGFDALVAKRFREARVRGFWGYLFYTIKESLGFKMLRMDIEIDGRRIHRRCLLVEMANAPVYGYGFTIVPPAKFNDGQLELLIVKAAPLWRYLLNTWRFPFRSFHRSALVELHTCTSLDIYPQDKAAYHLDGEGFDLDGPAHISIVPKSLKVMCPAAYADNFLREQLRGELQGA